MSANVGGDRKDQYRSEGPAAGTGYAKEIRCRLPGRFDVFDLIGNRAEGEVELRRAVEFWVGVRATRYLAIAEALMAQTA